MIVVIVVGRPMEAVTGSANSLECASLLAPSLQNIEHFMFEQALKAAASFAPYTHLGSINIVLRLRCSLLP
jgi:hypothetical protein